VRTVEIDGLPVEVEIVGHGDPVLFVHARPFQSWYQPLVAALDDHATVIYRRPVGDPETFSIERDAALVGGLISELGIDRPHVVGHSYGGLLALELARQRRVELRSLALLEPATSGLLEPAEAMARSAPLLDLARTDGPEAAMGAFLQAVTGPGGQDQLDELVPGARAQALAQASAFFATELPAAIRWSFGPADARAVELPVLNLAGDASEARFAASAAIIRDWFPGAVSVTIAGATHLLVAQAPREIAGRLRQFWG
jgi:pimeloyl-ACP methyl ester carboxylesterase